jgi:hypothetical protein
MFQFRIFFFQIINFILITCFPFRAFSSRSLIFQTKSLIIIYYRVLILFLLFPIGLYFPSFDIFMVDFESHQLFPIFLLIDSNLF